MAIEKLTIKKITSTDKSKDGVPFKDQKGVQKYRVGIQTAQHGSKWLSGFFYKVPTWNEGDTVELDVEANGEYLNFKVPKAEKVDEFTKNILTEIANKQTTIILKLDKLLSYHEPKKAPVVSGTNIPYPQMTKAPNFAPEQADSEDIDPSSIPF